MKIWQAIYSQPGATPPTEDACADWKCMADEDWVVEWEVEGDDKGNTTRV